MSQPDSNRTGGSELSAEAASFVPSHLQHSSTSPTTTAGNTQQSMADRSNSGSSRPETPSDLPHYVTNCYPFVSNDNSPDSAIRNQAVWQQKTLPNHTSTSQSGGHPHTHLPPPGMFTFTGSRPPGQLPGNNIRHIRPHHPHNNQQQRQIFRQPLPSPQMNTNPLQQPGLLPTPHIPPLLPNMAPRTPLINPGGILPYRMPLQQTMQATNPVLHQLGLMNQSSQALLNQGLLAGGLGTNVTNLLGNMQAASLLGVPQPPASVTNPTGKSSGSKGKKKKSKEWQASVTTRTQNDSGKSDGNSKKKQNRPKTIMCRDATCQTDFSESIANKTLAEKPSSLFQKEHTRNWPELYQESSTDSEEVDSDSGYSSPKRNQASSGTHPFTATQQPPVYVPEIVPYSNDLHASGVIQGAQADPVSGKYRLPAVASYKKALQSSGGTTTDTGNSPLSGLFSNATGSAIISPMKSHTTPGGHMTYAAVANAPAAKTVTNKTNSINIDQQTSRPKSAKNRKKKSEKQTLSSESSNTGSSNAFGMLACGGSGGGGDGGNSVGVLTGSTASWRTSSSHTGGSSQATSTTLSCDSGQEDQQSAAVLLLGVHKSSSHQEMAANTITISGPQQQELTSMEQQQLLQQEGDSDMNNITGTKRKRKRTRKQKKKGKSTLGEASPDLGATSGSEVLSSTASNLSKTTDSNQHLHLHKCDILHFEDENEFPDLLSAAGGLSDPSSHAAQSLSYSDILKGQYSRPLSQDSLHSMSSGGGIKSSPDTGSVKSSKEDKYARRRRKRQEQVDRAASEELAEISLEQQVLRELSVKSQQENEKKKPAGKKTKQPISLSIADMISALEEQQQKKEEEALLKSTKQPNKTSTTKVTVANMLDATAPKKRGKEREVPKMKKPSPMKKIILKEREEKKRLRLLDEGVDIGSDPGDGLGVTEPNNNSQDCEDEDYEEGEEGMEEGESGEDEEEEEEEEPEAEDVQSQDLDMSSNRSSLEIGTGTTVSADLSPISQTSPVSMSPPSTSPSGSGLSSPVAGIGRKLSSSVVTRIHSRRFREYCTQVLDKEIDSCCTVLLQELVRFQDRIYHRDPTKSKSKRRIVLGIRECAKHLKLRKLKCVVISPNLERIQSKGGLDDALNGIIEDCQLQGVPFVFALGRRALGRACAKLVPVSVVGIFNYDGCEENFKSMIELTRRAREAYTDMVDIIENEILDDSPSSMQPQAPLSANGGGGGGGGTMSVSGTAVVGDVQKFFPHLGHSRTPSACSAISFCSSILSEPISENYPHSEPETDSRGYEIVKDNKSTGEDSGTDALREKLDKMEQDTDGEFDLHDSGDRGQIQISENVNDIDEGHEADTEDNPHGHVQKKSHPWADDRETGKGKSSGKGDNSSGMGSSDPDDTGLEDADLKDAEILSNKEIVKEDSYSINNTTNNSTTDSAEVLETSSPVCHNCVSSIKDSGEGVECSEDNIKDDDDNNDEDSFKEFENDTLEDLPHMDSLHTNLVNVISDHCSSDILSQQSSRTLDLSLEATSTHSSKTLDADNNSRHASIVGVSSSDANSQQQAKVKTLDKERIESWVIDTQKQFELISIEGNEEGEGNGKGEEGERLDIEGGYSEVNGVLGGENEEQLEQEQQEHCEVCVKGLKHEDTLTNSNDTRSNEKSVTTDNSTNGKTAISSTTNLLHQGAKTCRLPDISGGGVNNGNVNSDEDVVMVTGDRQNNHCVNQLDNNKWTSNVTNS